MSEYKIIQNRFTHMGLRPVGTALCRRLGLNPQLAAIPRPLILYSACCGIYSANHKFFDLVFTDEDGMRVIFENICRNLNLVNTLSCVDFIIDIRRCPKVDDPDWICTTLGQLDVAFENLPFGIREILPEDVNLFISLCGGLFKLRESINLITVCSRVVMEEQRMEGAFDSYEDYIEACDIFPSDFQIFLRHVETPGEEWLSNFELFGPFPDTG